MLFAILWFVRTRTRQPNGVLTGLFFICYAIFRIVIENFREPDAELIGSFTRGQFFSFFLIVIGVAFIVAAKRHPTFPKKLSAKSFSRAKSRHRVAERNVVSRDPSTPLRFAQDDMRFGWRFRKTALLLIPVTRECSFRKS